MLDLSSARISVVTPTLYRPQEVAELIRNLAKQSLTPFELILIDGAPPEEATTEDLVYNWKSPLPFTVQYIRRGGGTAIQRNVGIDYARGEFIAFIDDDIRLEPDFFEVILNIFKTDVNKKIGGITGYITNQYLDINTSSRWKWYRRLDLFSTYEPSRYDYQSGYPINRYLQPPHNRLREVDFISTNSAVWRKDVFEPGLRFDPFFTGFGVLEDAHLALRAAKIWKLLECGSAHCIHLKSSSGRENYRLVAKKTAVNYRYVFIDIVPQRTLKQEYRFWRVQLVDLLRFTLYALRFPSANAWLTSLGKIEGIFDAAQLHQTHE